MLPPRDPRETSNDERLCREAVSEHSDAAQVKVHPAPFPFISARTLRTALSIYFPKTHTAPSNIDYRPGFIPRGYGDSKCELHVQLESVSRERRGIRRYALL